MTLGASPIPLLPRPATPPAGPPRVAFVTLGCKVNQSDTQKAIADFRGGGLPIVPPSAPAEVYMVNTCSRNPRGRPQEPPVAAPGGARQPRRAGRRHRLLRRIRAATPLAEMHEVGLVIGYREQGDDLLRLVLDAIADAESAHAQCRDEPLNDRRRRTA